MRTFPASSSRTFPISRNYLRLLTMIVCVAVAATTLGATSSSARSVGAAILGKAASLIGKRDTNQKASRGFISSPTNINETQPTTTVVARTGHTATLLRDGRVLIAGGENATGALNQTELFDPVNAIFSTAGNMRTARVDHSATLLPDGRVLLAGGRNSGGPLSSTEIFDPQTGAFNNGPSLNSSRAGHSATPLGDGRILFAGGESNGSAELFDPSSSNVQPANGLLNGARSFHSASVLTDGRVLIAGGQSASGSALDSAEIFDPISGVFTPAGHMNAARVRAHLRLLFDGKVQVIGGNNDGTMEVYDPAAGLFGGYAHVLPATDTCAGLKSSILATETRSALFHNGQSDSFLDRSGETITELAGNHALIAGGKDSNGVVLSTAAIVESSTASITTDKLDYYPGETVLVSGLGWQPGESVHVTLHEDPHTPLERGFDVVVDSSGNLNGTYLVQSYDLSMKFIAAAKGSSSGFRAQTTLSDSPRIASVTVGAQENTVTYGAGGGATFTVTPARLSDGTVNGVLTVTSVLPAGVTASFSPNAGTWTATNSDPFPSFTLTLNTSADSPAGVYPFTVQAADGGDQTTADGTLTIGQASVTPSITANNKVYDGNTNATLSSKTLSGVLAADVANVTLNVTSSTFGDRNVGNAKVVTASGLSLTGAASTNYALASSSAGANANITQRSITVQANPSSKTYDGTVNAPATPSISGGSLATGDTMNFTETFADKNVGSGKLLTPFGNVNDGNGGNNYAVSLQKAGGSINARTITVRSTTNTKPYDGNATAAATPTVVVGSIATGDTANFTETYDNKNVGNAKTLTPSGKVVDGNSGNNYSVAFQTVTTGVITARSVTVTATSNSKTYDGTTTATAVPAITNGSLLAGDTASFTESYNNCHAGANKTLIPSGSISDGNSGNNYAISFVNDTTGVINAKPITVSAVADTKVYDGTNSSSGSPSISPALVSGDSSNFSQSFDNKNAGNNKTLVPSGAVTDGNGGNDYVVTFANASNGVITARLISITASTDSKEYDGTTTSVAAPVVSNGSIVSGDNGNFFQSFDDKNAGSNKTLVPQGSVNDGNGGTNYQVTFVNNTTGEITQRALSVSGVAGQTKIYGDADPVFNYQLTNGSLVAGDSLTGSPSRVTGESVGAYELTAGTLSAGSNYHINFVPANFNITQRAISVTADAKSKQYGEADPEFTYQFTSGSLAFNDALSGVLTRDAGENAGNYAINQGSLSAGANYTLAYVGANLTINKRAASVTANDKTRVYGEANPVLDATVSGTINGDALNYSVTTAATQSSGVGSYPISVTLGGNPNYDVTSTDGSLTITSRAIEVTATAGQTKVYGNADPSTFSFTVTSGALATGDSFSGSLSRNAGEIVGAYAITQGSLAAGANYSLSFVSADFSITKRLLGITADALTKVYGDADPSLTFHVTDGTLATGDSFTGTLARVAGENVGSYAIQQGTLSAGPNYSLSFHTANLSITAKPLFITADNKAMVFGGTVPSFTASFNGFVNGENPANLNGLLAFTVKDSPGQTEIVVVSSTTPAGTYAIIPGGVTSTNYDINFVAGTLLITANTSSWELRGFYQPVNMSTATTMIMNMIKGGSTIPLKFNIFANGVEKTSVTDVQSIQVATFSCGSVSAFEYPIDVQSTGATALRYENGQFIQNWQTPHAANKCYQVRMTAGDGSHLDAFFKTK